MIEKVLTETKINIIKQTFFESLQFDKALDLDDWSDKHRVLPQESSSEFGPWRTSRFPFLRRIMKCLSPSSKARRIAVIKGAQLGFSELAVNWMLYTACHDPGPFLYTQKTEDATKDFIKQRLDPSIDLCKNAYYTIGRGKLKFIQHMGQQSISGRVYIIGWC